MELWAARCEPTGVLWDDHAHEVLAGWLLGLRPPQLPQTLLYPACGRTQERGLSAGHRGQRCAIYSQEEEGLDGLFTNSDLFTTSDMRAHLKSS